MRRKTSISYTLLEASEATSVGKDRIREACESNDLPSYWAGAKRVILATDLQDWIESLPTERAK